MAAWDGEVNPPMSCCASEAEDAAELNRKSVPATESGGRQSTDNSTASTKVKRKRRFPYRKVDELEKEVMEQEELVAELEAQMVSPEIYRDANLVKETMQDFEDAKDHLKTLYEHWEEAAELNG